VQTCSICQTQTSDTVRYCPNCQADLQQNSTTAVVLKKHQANPRVSLIKISICGDACPACYEAGGAYAKDAVPRLPIESCSHALGCRCFYEPVLEEVYP